MKQIKLNEETTKKFKEALDVFMVNQKKGNAMLDKIYEEQQQQTNKKGNDNMTEEELINGLKSALQDGTYSERGMQLVIYIYAQKWLSL